MNPPTTPPAIAPGFDRREASLLRFEGFEGVGLSPVDDNLADREPVTEETGQSGVEDEEDATLLLGGEATLGYRVCGGDPLRLEGKE